MMKKTMSRIDLLYSLTEQPTSLTEKFLGPSLKLCNLCTSLNLAHRFSAGRIKLEPSGRVGAIQLGTLSQIRRRQHCVFCIWLADFIEAAERQRSQYVLKGADRYIELTIEREYDFHKRSWFTIARVRYCNSATYDIAELRASEVEESTVERLQSVLRTVTGQESSQLCGPIEALESTSTLVRHWLKGCKRSHPRCATSKKPLDISIHVIDTRATKVVQLPFGSPYLALSYVWGKVAPATLDESYTIQNVPTTVKDAIDFAFAIGYHYLWVDAVCVSRESHDARLNDILMMDYIYSNADAVILAASGIDANHGLRGVSRMARPYKSFRFPSTILRCRTLEDTMMDPTLGRQYLDRCWTLQEALLARRRIIFTEQEILFECSVAVGRERLGHRFEIAEFDSSLFGSLRSLPQLEGSSGSTPAHEIKNIYHAVVHRFLSRKITYEYDLKNAFQGLANHIARALDDKPCWTTPRKILLWGMLWCPHERSKWSRYGEEVSAEEKEKAIIRRRANPPGDCPFPSWFWGAWVMENATWSDAFSTIGNRSSVGSFTADDGAITEDWTDEQWNSIEATGILEMQGEIVYPTQKTFDADIDERFYLPRGEAERHWKQGTCSFITTKAWVSIFIGVDISALAVVAKDGIYYRVGHLRLAQKDWEAASPVQTMVKLG